MFKKPKLSTLCAKPVIKENFLTLEINPEEHLDFIIEQVKELYICYHLKDKNFRRTAAECCISRSMIRRIADKFEMNNYRPNL